MSTPSVLIVEDDAAALTLTRRVLSRARPNLNLLVAMDGEEAIVKILEAERNKQLPLIILLDWNLPKKHGREVLAEVRANPGTQGVPVVIVTSSNAEPDQSEAMALGANEFVHKSLSLDEFRQALTATCDKYLGAET